MIIWRDPATQRQPGIDEATYYHNLKTRRGLEVALLIDFSDIGEFTDEWFAGAVRGKLYRPAKGPSESGMDQDVLAIGAEGWVQTRINDTLPVQAPLSAKRKARGQFRANCDQVCKIESRSDLEGHVARQRAAL